MERANSDEGTGNSRPPTPKWGNQSPKHDTSAPTAQSSDVRMEECVSFDMPTGYWEEIPVASAAIDDVAGAKDEENVTQVQGQDTEVRQLKDQSSHESDYLSDDAGSVAGFDHGTPEFMSINVFQDEAERETDEQMAHRLHNEENHRANTGRVHVEASPAAQSAFQDDKPAASQPEQENPGIKLPYRTRVKPVDTNSDAHLQEELRQFQAEHPLAVCRYFSYEHMRFPTSCSFCYTVKIECSEHNPNYGYCFFHGPPRTFPGSGSPEELQRNARKKEKSDRHHAEDMASGGLMAGRSGVRKRVAKPRSKSPLIMPRTRRKVSPREEEAIMEQLRANEDAQAPPTEDEAAPSTDPPTMGSDGLGEGFKGDL